MLNLHSYNCILQYISYTYILRFVRFRQVCISSDCCSKKACLLRAYEQRDNYFQMLVIVWYCATSPHLMFLLDYAVHIYTCTYLVFLHFCWTNRIQANTEYIAACKSDTILIDSIDWLHIDSINIRCSILIICRLQITDKLKSLLMSWYICTLESQHYIHILILFRDWLRI